MNILQEDHLSNLPEDLIDKAKHMSKAYEYMYCIENMLRLFLIEKLPSEFTLPASVKKQIQGRKIEEDKHLWVPLRGESDIYYTDFADLIKIITENWLEIQDFFPGQMWIVSRLEDLKRFRNMIAHNSYIDATDFDTVKVYFNSISRQLKLTSPSTSQMYLPESFVKGLKFSKIYSSKEVNHEIVHHLSFPPQLDNAPISVETYFSGVGPLFKVNIGNSYVRLNVDSTVNDTLLLDSDSQIEGVRVEIGQYDIDNDGVDEIFICIQKFTDTTPDDGLVINVSKYYPPLFSRHTNRDENWQALGTFVGCLISNEPIAFLKDRTIRIPRNFREQNFQWTYVNWGFIDEGF